MVFAVLLLNSLQPCEQQWEPVCQVVEQNHGFHLASFVLVRSLGGCFSFLGGSCFGFEEFFFCLFVWFVFKHTGSLNISDGS